MAKNSAQRKAEIDAIQAEVREAGTHPDKAGRVRALLAQSAAKLRQPGGDSSYVRHHNQAAIDEARLKQQPHK